MSTSWISCRGSSGSLFLNFALPLLSVFISLIIALSTTKIEPDRLYQGYLIVSVISAIAGGILLVLWWREHRSSKNLISEIKNRMPPPFAVPQVGPEAGTGTETGRLP